ncbi:alpha/beta fold hydrolase [Alloalcanivorax mobilis]|uniref:alpha/beta fold hydrolase n=1 Tax=Alloalcanivorax mobilis TaxID=2019569 RepID=UPI000B5B1508|nr:alpha/beta hydrolase [Alloalcanivorax mobilis]ASK35449.1 alpha/beta hydrolase [Alcanivorax sp. N3-2A]|tara:strand:- start:33 stop:923 length:891 start_codon:yes stop_codon:yes gene_type:complete
MATGTVHTNGIELFYETRGPEQGEPVVFIMGLSAQLVFWPEALLDALANRGYRVIAFDNRDAGKSTLIRKPFRYGPLMAMLRYMAGMKVDAPYTLDDLVADTVGLMDALGIDKAHLVGASMGGMIAQLTAATHPQRVLSLTSIMSSNNSPFLPPPRPAALKTLVAPRVKIETVEQYVAFGLTMMTTIGGTLDPGREELEQMFRRSWERGLNPRGIRNQFMAILATGNLSKRLKRVHCPTQIIHGGSDPLIRPAGGRASAKAIRGARLAIIDGMGHDLPPSIVPRVADLIAANAERA